MIHHSKYFLAVIPCLGNFLSVSNFLHRHYCLNNSSHTLFVIEMVSKRLNMLQLFLCKIVITKYWTK